MSAHTTQRTKGVLLVLTIALSVTGCAVGPRFTPPAPPAASGYTRDALPRATQAIAAQGGEAQRFQFGRDLAGEGGRCSARPGSMR
jgi:hypothetical protein